MHGEVPYVPAQHKFALSLQLVSYVVPALDDCRSGFEQLGARRIGCRFAAGKFADHVIESLAQCVRLSPCLGPVEHVLGRSLGLASHGPRCGIGVDSEPTHLLGKVLAPLPEHGLIDMKASPAVLAFGFDDQVHMGVVLVSVQHHGVSVHGAELLAGESPRRGQHLPRRRRGGHRKDDVVDELHRPRDGPFPTRPPVLAG